MKRKSAALFAGMCVVTVWAADLDKPWGQWDASGAKDLVNYAGTDYYTRVADLSGNGRDLNLGYDIQPQDKEDFFRGKVFDVRGYSDTYLYGTAPAFGGFTVSVWINRSENTGVYTKELGSPMYLVAGLNGLALTSDYGTNVWKVLLDGTETGVEIPSPLSVWHLVTVTVDGGTVAAYLNGVLIQSVMGISHTGSAGTFNFFSSQGANNRHGFRGLADEVRVYDAALSSNEVDVLYKSGNPARLTGHWPCDRVDGAGAARSTTNLVNAALPLVLGSLVTATNGVCGEGALFFNAPVNDGETVIDCYGSTTSSIANVRGDLTFMMWYKREADQNTPNNARIVSFDNGTSGYEFLLPTAAEGINLATYMFNYSSPDHYYILAPAGQWCHFAWTLEYAYQPDANGLPERKRRTRVYRNGELVATAAYVSDESDSFFTGFPYSYFRVGNRAPKNRPFRGTLDDIRLYRGMVTPEFVRTVYRGPAAVYAGEDFTARSTTAELHGVISHYSFSLAAAGFAGDPAWTLVNWPEGGSGATVENPHAAVTRVTLPVPGVYVFRISNTVEGVSFSDDVIVTRVAETANTPPTLVCSVKDATGLCAVVTAAATDADADPVRLRWRKLSGPGGVWFSSDDAAEPVVTFSAPGAYVLECAASDGQTETTATVAVTPTGTTLDAQLATNLLAYWPCDFAVSSTAYTDPADTVSGRILLKSGANSIASGAGYDLGVSGTYSVRNADLKTAYFKPNPDLTHSEGSTVIDGLTLPQEEWKTLSCWMYHDGSYTNPLSVCALYSVRWFHMFLYLPKFGAGADFRIVQCTARTNGDVFSTFTGPGENITNKWVHVVFQANQHKTADHEVWVNGQKLAASTMNRDYGRFNNSSAAYIGGNGYNWEQSYNTDVDPDHVSDPYPFPGKLDEIRIYARHLSEAEIRYLHAHPTATRETLAPSVTVPLSSVRMVARRTSAPITASAYAANTSKTLVYLWKVVSGDAAKVVFSDAAVLAPTATVYAPGEYAFQLVVTDGDRTTYSEPVSVCVAAGGTILKFK